MLKTTFVRSLIFMILSCCMSLPAREKRVARPGGAYGAWKKTCVKNGKTYNNAAPICYFDSNCKIICPKQLSVSKQVCVGRGKTSYNNNPTCQFSPSTLEEYGLCLLICIKNMFCLDSKGSLWYNESPICWFAEDCWRLCTSETYLHPEIVRYADLSPRTAHLPYRSSSPIATYSARHVCHYRRKMYLNYNPKCFFVSRNCDWRCYEVENNALKS